MFSNSTKEAANETVRNAKTTVYNAKADLNDAAATTKNDLTDTAANAGRQVRVMVDTASEQLKTLSGSLEGEVRANPVRSSFIAAGVGFILGALLSR